MPTKAQLIGDAVSAYIDENIGFWKFFLDCLTFEQQELFGSEEQFEKEIIAHLKDIVSAHSAT